MVPAPWRSEKHGMLPEEHWPVVWMGQRGRRRGGGAGGGAIVEEEQQGVRQHFKMTKMVGMGDRRMVGRAGWGGLGSCEGCGLLVFCEWEAVCVGG